MREGAMRGQFMLKFITLHKNAFKHIDDLLR